MALPGMGDTVDVGPAVVARRPRAFRSRLPLFLLGGLLLIALLVAVLNRGNASERDRPPATTVATTAGGRTATTPVTAGATGATTAGQSQSVPATTTPTVAASTGSSGGVTATTAATAGGDATANGGNGKGKDAGKGKGKG
jgi:hypothetical protein